MEQKSVFDFRDYKHYLRQLEKAKAREGRGFRALLAKAAGCQTAYISQILNGAANLNLDQAHAINRMLSHDKSESRLFLLLIEFARAGSQALRLHLADEIEEHIQKHLNLEDRFQIREILSEQDQNIYYSEWTYAAVHMAVTIPEFQTPKAISEFLNISRRKTEGILKFFIESGLAKSKGGDVYEIGATRLHLGRGSPLLPRHHANWRLQAVASLEAESQEQDLHFTSIVSLSREDVVEIKSRLIKEIDRFNAIVKDSKEETVSCLTLDFFSVRR